MASVNSYITVTVTHICGICGVRHVTCIDCTATCKAFILLANPAFFNTLPYAFLRVNVACLHACTYVMLSTPHNGTAEAVYLQPLQALLSSI